MALEALITSIRLKNRLSAKNAAFRVQAPDIPTVGEVTQNAFKNLILKQAVAFEEIEHTATSFGWRLSLQDGGAQASGCSHITASWESTQTKG